MAYIIDLTEDEVFEIIGRAQARVYGAKALMRNEREALGVGGFFEVPDDPRLWGFLDGVPMTPRQGLQVITALKAQLKSFGRDVFVQCDGDFAARLLKALGFEPTKETRADRRNGQEKEVWIWRHSQHSQ